MNTRDDVGQAPIGFVGTQPSDLTAQLDVVSPGFFETIGIPMVQGRGPRWSDTPQAPPVSPAILAFAERVLSKASELWVHAPLDQRQSLQQLSFPEGVPFDGNRFSRTAANLKRPGLKPFRDCCLCARARFEDESFQGDRAACLIQYTCLL
jgi:hypothetical protein